MSEFKRALAELEKMTGFLEQLEDGSMDIETQKHGIDSVVSTLETWAPKIEKFRAKANEKDKDKKVYNDAMVAKVLAFLVKWDALVPQAEEWAERVEQEFAPYRTEKEAEIEAERRKRAEEEREKERQLQELRRAEEEAKRQAAEEKARLEEEEKEAIRQRKEAADRQAQEEREVELKRREDLAVYLGQNRPSQVLMDSVRMLQDATRTEPRMFELTVQAVHGVISNVVSYPDEEPFKTIRKSNPRFHADIGRHPGAIGCLFALGFREVYEQGENKETLLILEEPNVVEEYEQWKEWLDQATDIKNKLDLVLAAISNERYTHRPVDVRHLLSRDE